MLTDSLRWIDPAGVATMLTGQDDLDVYWTAGIKGRMAPPFAFAEEPIPLQQGSLHRQTRATPREVAIPLTVIGPSETLVRGKVRQLIAAFNPLRGEGRLVVDTITGDSRTLFCRYASGMEGDEGISSSGARYAKYLAVFRAPDPFWHDTDAQSVTYSTEGADPFFPIFPLRVAAQASAIDIPINVIGDVVAEPVWTFTGPGNGARVDYTPPGSDPVFFEVDVALNQGDTLVVDTRTGQKRVYRVADGSNVFGSLTTGSSLFGLQPGEGVVTASFGSGTDAAFTRIDLAYRNRYLSV